MSDTMLHFRDGTKRRHTLMAGLDTWMSFDPENRRDIFCDGFRSLHSLDEISLGPGNATAWKSQENRETLTYILEGIMLQADSQGKTGIIRAGDFQLHTTGIGVGHEQINGSWIDRAHIVESRFLSTLQDIGSVSEQKRFSFADRKGTLCLIVSPDGRKASLRLRQDARVFSSLPDRGCHLIHELKQERFAWLQILRGRVRLNGQALVAGDGVAFEDERFVSFTALEPSEILLFDLG